jgi:SAM-dependent methyltransferase
MLTDTQFKEGVAYAVDNFINDHASHLKIDKQLISSQFDLNGKKILDFGCGMGGMSLWYADNFDCEVYALDIDAHHIKIANHIKSKYKIQNVIFDKRNILDTPLEEQEKFDYIFLNDVAEHIELSILEAIFRQLKNGLTDSGKIFVTFPPWKSPYASHVVHAVKIPWCQFLPEKVLMNLLEKNNLQIVGEEESDLISAYKGLNHLTYKKLLPVIQKAGLKVIDRKTHCILNKVPSLQKINFNVFPLDYLITKEFVLLH